MNFEKQITLKNGQQVLLRYPQDNDTEALIKFINAISQEDTFLLLSGEVINYDEEKVYLENCLKEIKEQNKIQILALLGADIIANVEVRRLTKQRKRSLHVGEIAISVAKDFRGLGLGRIILSEIINQSKNLGLRQVFLTTFSVNERAKVLYKNLGFQTIGEIPGQILYQGKYVGQTYMYLPLIKS